MLVKSISQMRIGQEYYSPCPSRSKLYVKLKWEGSEWDEMRLRRSLVHTTPVSAVKAGAAMLNVVLGG